MNRKSEEALASTGGEQLSLAGVSGSEHVRKDTILERLNKRNKDRQNYLDSRLDQRNKENVEAENADYFAQQFTERAHDVDARIKNLDEVAAKKWNMAGGDTSVGGPSSDLVRLIAGISKEIQELQRYLTTSTMFLTEYKIKSCQTLLNELTSSLDETRLRLVPKKKFGFSGKKVATKQCVNPKIAAAMQASAAAAAATTTSIESDISDAATTLVTPSASTAPTFEWTLSDRKDEHICLKGDEVNDRDVTISHVTRCLIELQGHAGSVQLTGIHDCVVLCGPVSRSVFAENCSGVTFAIACQQLRLHSSHHCRIHLHVTCRAIIEDCHHIEITSYRYNYASSEADYNRSGLDRQVNNYHDVADFDWLSPDVPSPNWTLLSIEHPASNADPDWKAERAKFSAKDIEAPETS